jgi:hypothetical protein
MVSIVAPQTPVWPSFVSRQGPIPQSLQHIPVEPTLQGAIASALVNAVEIPNSSARISICWAAGSMDCSSGVRFFLAISQLLFHVLDGSHARTWPEWPARRGNLLGEIDRITSLHVGDAMTEEGLIAVLSFANVTPFNRYRDFSQVTGLAEDGLDLVWTQLSLIVRYFDNLETATGVYFAYARQFQQEVPNLCDMMIAIHRWQIKRQIIHDNFLLEIEPETVT